MAITKTLSVDNKQHYLFRYEEEITDEHGRSHIRGVPFHVTLTMPTGVVTISKYGYKESTKIEISIDEIKELQAMLAACASEREAMLKMPS